MNENATPGAVRRVDFDPFGWASSPDDAFRGMILENMAIAVEQMLVGGKAQLVPQSSAYDLRMTGDHGDHHAWLRVWFVPAQPDDCEMTIDGVPDVVVSCRIDGHRIAHTRIRSTEPRTSVRPFLEALRFARPPIASDEDDA